jgi:hypothetical protein
VHTKGLSHTLPKKITRRTFIGTTAAACAYTALSPMLATAKRLSFDAHLPTPVTSGITWPPTQALPSFAAPAQLDAADITSLTNDQQLLLTSLQGIVNRTQPRIYLFQNGDGTDQSWLQTTAVPNTVTTDPLSLIAKYSADAAGAVIYDPTLPDTANVATSLAGVMGGVIATADLASQYSLPILADLRGQFATKLDAYNWLIDNYWTQLTPRMLTAISPTTSNLRDYIVATKSLVFWLDPEVPDEATLFAQILQKVAPDTPYMGWFVGGHESSGVTLCSQNGVVVGAADFLDNATVLGGVPATISQSQPPATTPKLEKKIYLTFTFSDGDNLQYDQHRLRTIWDDPNRGAVPLNWTISPLLLDAAPIMLHYYQSTQTPNDLLIAGPSGAGYTYPGDWPSAALSAFTKQTGDYMARAGLTLIDALNLTSQGSNAKLTNRVAHDYSRDAHPLGILCNWQLDSSTLQKTAGLPIMSQAFIVSVGQGKSTASRIGASWSGHHALFAAILVDSWNMTPTDVNTVAASLGSQFEIVRGDVFFDLLRKH